MATNQSVAILLAVLQAIGVSAVLALAGVYATRRKIITDGGRKCLAELSMNLLMPCLLFTSMIKCAKAQCTPVSEMIKISWVLMILPLFVVGSGMALGKLVSITTGCPKNFEKACVGSVAFANSTGMSITLLQVLSPVLLQTGVVQIDPMKFLPVYLLLYPMLQWTVGSYLFGLIGGGSKEADGGAVGDKKSSKSDKSLTKSMSRKMTKGLADIFDGELPDLGLATDPDFYPTDQPCHCAEMEMERERTGSPDAVGHRMTFSDMRRMYSQASSDDDMAGTRTRREIIRSSTGSVERRSSSSDDRAGTRASMKHVGFSKQDSLVESQEDESTEEESNDESSGSDDDNAAATRRGCRSVMGSVRKVIKNALVPPVVGSALGLLVALVPPVQRLFVQLPGAEDMPTPLAFLFQAMQAIGSASVPVNMMVLGTNLSKGCDFHAVPLATNIGILVMKQVGQPLMMTGVIFALSRLLTPQLELWIVAMIVSCTPTANNIMVMVELSGQNKPGMTACIFTQYMAAPFLLTGVVSGFLLARNYILP